MKAFDRNRCPIKLEHIHLDPGAVVGAASKHIKIGTFSNAFDRPFMCYAAYILLRMLREEGHGHYLPGDISRPFTTEQFRIFSKGLELFSWEGNPSHKKGYEALIHAGYLIPAANAHWVISLEFLGRCFVSSPDPSIVSVRRATTDAPN